MYNLELEKAAETINKENARLVCIQLPDGLKPKADEIQEFLEKNTNSTILTWFSTCYGACDIPNIKDIDLLIQFGHERWKNA